MMSHTETVTGTFYDVFVALHKTDETITGHSKEQDISHLIRFQRVRQPELFVIFGAENLVDALKIRKKI